MNKLPISVFIITLNEEKNIARALRSVSFADEVIVVDCGSTDATLDIVKSFGISPVHNDWPGYARQKQFAMEQCRHDWVLNIDADEEISSALVKRFEKVMNEQRYASVRCVRSDLFMNQALSRWSKRPNNRRFYRKSLAHFNPDKLVHESATIDGKELFVTEPIIHHGYGTIEILMNKNNNYSSLKAKEKHSKNKSFSYLKLSLIFPLVFIQQWIFNGKIFSGTRGFILSMIEAHYAFSKEAKLYELKITD